ncbi:hypothetical protein V5799_005287, partial [Amblyomma americanum]
MENDTWEVKLLTFPLRQVPDSSYTILQSNTQCNLMHWAALFRNSRGDVLVLEGLRHGRMLVPNISNWFDTERVRSEVLLGHIESNEYCIMHIGNKQRAAPYDVIQSNCQTYVINVLHEFGIDVPGHIRTFGYR